MGAPKIFRGKIDGREKYCRLLIRRRNAHMERRKACPVCGQKPFWHWSAEDNKYAIVCDNCQIEALHEDAEILVNEWNSMDAGTLLNAGVLDYRRSEA